MPVPFNFFLIFFAPMILTSKNPQPVNQKFLFISYIPILIATTACFIAGEILMWPFSYLKMIFHKLTMVWVYSKSYRTSRADKFIKFIFFVFFGPIITIGNSFVDTYFMIRHLIKFDLQKIKHKIKNKAIKKENLEIIRKYFQQKQEKVLNFKDISNKIREDMDIMNQIQMTLFPDIDQITEQKDEMEELKDLEDEVNKVEHALQVDH